MTEFSLSFKYPACRNFFISGDEVYGFIKIRTAQPVTITELLLHFEGDLLLSTPHIVDRRVGRLPQSLNYFEKLFTFEASPLGPLANSPSSDGLEDEPAATAGSLMPAGEWELPFSFKFPLYTQAKATGNAAAATRPKQVIPPSGLVWADGYICLRICYALKLTAKVADQPAFTRRSKYLQVQSSRHLGTGEPQGPPAVSRAQLEQYSAWGIDASILAKHPLACRLQLVNTPKLEISLLLRSPSVLYQQEPLPMMVKLHILRKQPFDAAIHLRSVCITMQRTVSVSVRSKPPYVFSYDETAPQLVLFAGNQLLDSYLDTWHFPKELFKSWKVPSGPQAFVMDAVQISSQLRFALSFAASENGPAQEYTAVLPVQVFERMPFACTSITD